MENNNFTPNSNFRYYLYWICERQNIFWKRFNNEIYPYSEDEILNSFKFTNVYRVLDRSSQYLIKNVIYDGNFDEKDFVWRIILYKHLNLPNTWDYLEKNLGVITLKTSLINIDNCLKDLIKKDKIYSNAYMITAFPPFSKYFGLKWPKHSVYLKIFKDELIDSGLIDEILKSESLEGLFWNLKKLTNYGDFISYQIAQDLNYTKLFDFDDNSFVEAGPGTQRGIQRTFEIKGKPDFSEIIKWVYKNFEQLLEDYSKKFDMNLEFKPLPNHMPTVADYSNSFCETDKYMRGMGIETEGVKVDGKRIKSTFKPNSENIDYVFPAKWNVGVLK